MKILFVSYVSFPKNIVGAYRINSFCDTFHNQGANVTLITKNWEDESTNKIVECHANGYRIYKLPFKYVKANRLLMFRKIIGLFDYLIGNIHPTTNVYKNFKDFSLELIKKENDFDIVYVTCDPDNSAKLAYFLNKKTNIPYIVDYRDFLNNKYLLDEYSPSLRERYIDITTEYYTHKWINKAALITTTSPRHLRLFRDKYYKNTLLIMNGYEQSNFVHSASNPIKVVPSQIFTIRYIGTIHEVLDLDVIIKGIIRFTQKNPSKKILIEIIGSLNPNVNKLFLDNIHLNNINIIAERLPKKVVVDLTINSDILLLSLSAYRETYGTKIFDYIASGSHILLAPSKDKIVEDLAAKTNNYSVANSVEEFVSCIENQYDFWLKNENKSQINAFPEYSRENISLLFYNEVSNIVTKNKRINIKE